MKKMIFSMFLTVSLFSSQSALAWNGTGHQIVASIAWDEMSDKARQNVVSLLLKAPNNACLRQLFRNDSRPLEERQREFFVRAATWADIVRPRDDSDTRPCTQYHKRNWHFVNYFWKGRSGDPNNPPTDLPMPVASVNAVERLRFFRTYVTGNFPATKRAMGLAWILHLVGDIHQPLHTSGRVTSLPSEQQGDAGGNLFKLGPELSLHSYWDGIVDRTDPKKPNEIFAVYLERVATEFKSSRPKSQVILLPGQFDKWALESFARAKNKAYPKELKRGVLPGQPYRDSTFEVASDAIPEAGYRLGDLLNQLFGS